MAAVNCFFVDPAIFEETMVREMLKPNDWK